MEGTWSKDEDAHLLAAARREKCATVGEDGGLVGGVRGVMSLTACRRISRSPARYAVLLLSLP